VGGWSVAIGRLAISVGAGPGQEVGLGMGRDCSPEGWRSEVMRVNRGAGVNRELMARAFGVAQALA
jgi:hypothetical protein